MGPNRGTPGKPGQPTSNGDRKLVSCEELRRNAKYNILFDKVDIEKLVQTVADATCKTFILPETVRGKISIIGPENGKGEVDSDQFYAAFLAALDTNNLTVYPYGHFLKIVDKSKSKSSPIPTLVDPDEHYTTNEQMVTRFFKVRYVEVDRLKAVLQGLVSQPGGDITSFEPDTIIITDEGSNMHRLERIIKQLDAPSSSSELRIIRLTYAAAQDVADKIQKLFEAKGSRPGQPARPGMPATPPLPTTGAAPGQPAAVGQPAGESSSTGPATLSQMIPDERTNKLIIVASPAAFERIVSLIAAIDVPIAGEGRINVYFLQNTAAEELASTLQSLSQGTQNRPRTPGQPISQLPGQPPIPGQPARTGPVTAAELFSGEVKISADKSSNALVIVASQNDYRSLRRIIEELDLPRRQVFIETVIMEVNLDRTAEFGINFSGGYVLKTDQFGNVPVLFGTKLRQSTPFTSLTNLSQFSGFLAGLQGPNIPELERLGLPVPQFGVVIHALQQSSDVNVLSTPHILASDNEEAEITVGQNVPFQAGFAPGNLGALGATGATGATGGVGGIGGLAGLGLGGLGSFFAPIQRQNVELKLTVKPHINKSDEIRMVINEQTEEIASQDPVLGPTTSKRSAKTTVIAKDQETVVLGGIMQDRTIESVTKVPVLGDIPILGHLFRDQTRKKVKTNLLLFLTPYIIKDRSDFRRIFERKMKERQQFIELFYGQVPGYDVAIDFGRKSGPVARVAQMIRQEEQKLENGGPGLPGERMITPAAPPRVPPELPRTEAPRSGEPAAPSPSSFAPMDAPVAGPSQPVPTEPIDPKTDGREAQNPADGQPAPDRQTTPG
ncbi:MAG TPA: type II secretion system secretin GspD, partial [Myxococcaceae bacterium]|nr:type II secretion system secretin GspD [Myxococcaceae bacterium]